MTGQYIVTTPKNPQYNGKTFGILFQAGRAFVSEHTINPALGLDADEIARRMNSEFGYDVQRVANSLPVTQAVLNGIESPVEAVAPVDVAEAEAKPKNKNQKRNKAGADEAPEESND